MLGCDKAQLLQYFNAMRNGYSGAIHMDHIRPCKDFDLSDPTEMAKCFHFLNLQPLTPRMNLTKGARWSAADNEAWTRRWMVLQGKAFEDVISLVEHTVHFGDALYFWRRPVFVDRRAKRRITGRNDQDVAREIKSD